MGSAFRGFPTWRVPIRGQRLPGWISFSQLARFPDAVERRRIAQGYSYRALAAYQVLEVQDREPSWLRKADRAQLESLSKQAFADISHVLFPSTLTGNTQSSSRLCYAAGFICPKMPPRTAHAVSFVRGSAGQ